MTNDQALLHRRALLTRAGGLGATVYAGSTLGALLGAPEAFGLARGGTLNAALTGEPDSLDPAVSQIYTGAQVYDNIFSKLVDIDEHQRFYGVLAKSWKQQDPRTWVFDLGPGVRFHNGEPFTAADVKYTFERILNPKTAS